MSREVFWRRVDVTGIEVAVFIAGFTSMGLEILAGRVVAPQFGSSIYTWGSVIGVFLAALSLGYYHGGKEAARGVNRSRITRHFLLATLFVAFVILGGDYVLRASSAMPLPSRYYALLPVTLLFGPPVYLLGFISPLAAELSVTESTGEASGNVYALGTIGSIAGAFATTFVLIPSLQIEHIGLLFGVVLVGTAAGLSWPKWSTEFLGQLFIVTIVLVGSVVGGSAGFTIGGDVVYQTQTPYQELVVSDSDGIRTLYLGGERHSAMDLQNPRRHVFDYTRYFHLPLLMQDDVDRVLFIGGGGFTGPKRFAADYNVTVHVAEIDPVVIDVAKAHFDVNESPDLQIHNQDGRQYLQETNETFDLIVLDAYQKDKVPFHLTTVEFMELAEGKLTDDGVLFANVISAPAGPGSDFYRAEYKTVDQVFPVVYGFSTSKTGLVQNMLLIATKHPDRLSRSELLARNTERDIGIDLREEITHYQGDVSTGDVPVLRDSYAPVDELLDPMAGRRYVIETNGTA